MGAFGAVLFGLMLDADAIIALAPEVVPGLKGTSSPSVVGDRTLFDSYYARNVLDLPQARKTRITAYFGEKALGDMLAGLAMRERFPRSCISLKNCFHSVAPFIHSVHGLDLFLKETIEHGRSDRLIGAYAGDLFHFPSLIEGLYRGVINGETDRFDHLIAAVPAEASSETRSYVHTAYAKHLIGRGRTVEATPHLRLAFALNRFDIETLALCLGHLAGDVAADVLTEDYLVRALEPHRHDLRPSFYEICALIACSEQPSLQRIRRADSRLFQGAEASGALPLPSGRGSSAPGRSGGQPGRASAGRRALSPGGGLPPPAEHGAGAPGPTSRRDRGGGTGREPRPDNAHLQQRCKALRIREEKDLVVVPGAPAAPPRAPEAA